MGRVVGAGQLKVIRFYVNTTGFSFLCNIQIIENRFWGEEGRGGGGVQQQGLEPSFHPHPS